mgnify:CR=1 FL=1
MQTNICELKARLSELIRGVGKHGRGGRIVGQVVAQ